MKKIFFSLFIILLFVLNGHTQQIGINEDGSIPNPNAILDIKSFKKGILIPRMSSNNRLSIPHTKGMLVYDTTTQSFWYNTGSAWQNMNGSSGPYKGNAWWLAGNAGTTPDDFLGTLDDVPLRFRINNEPAGMIERFNGNTFFGYASGTLVNLDSSTYNTAIGSGTLYQNGLGSANAALGYSALSMNTIGSYNTASGGLSMYSNTEGGYNTAAGGFSLQANLTGSYNVANGAFALYTNTSGHHNTANGDYSLYNSTTGMGNTAVGGHSLYLNTTGSYNTAIGYAADAGPNFTNSTAIGYQAVSGASNKVRIGNAAVTRIEGQVPFTTPSDGRFKYDVEENVKGLDFIMQLRPVTYHFDTKRFDEQQRDGKKNLSDAAMNEALNVAYTEASAVRHSGFIAQEVEKAAAVSGYDFSGIIKPVNARDHYSLSYESFVVPLVKAVQQQQEIIKAQQKQIDKIMGLLEKLQPVK
jgi:hypothetical protein